MTPSGAPLVSVILPTYREEGAIGPTLDGLAAALEGAGIPWEAIVVDDDSPDDTQKEVRERAERLGADRVRLIVRTQERGLASAVVRGFRESRGTYHAVMDADGQHPPDAMVRMVQTAEAEKADAVVGSRHTKGGSVGEFSALRRFISWGAGQMARVALPPVRKARITDPMSGLFLVHRDAVDPDALSPRGYKILLEVLAQLKPRGHDPVVREVPYTFGARHAGESKLGGRVMVDYILHLLSLGLRDRENRRFAQFALVGGSGVLVNLGLIALGGMLFGATTRLLYILNAAISREIAVTWNFIWNDVFTYRDMRRHTGFNWFVRFLRFNVVSLGSFGIYIAVAAILERTGMHYLVASLIAIIIGVLVNFRGNTEWTYVSKRHREARRERRLRAKLAQAP